MPTTLEHRPTNHIEMVRDLKESKYIPLIEFVLEDGLIEPVQLSDEAKVDRPGTYVWVCEKGWGPDHHQHVLYIGEHGNDLWKRIANQHWRSWTNTTRSNVKNVPDKQKGDEIIEWLKKGYTVKVYNKPSAILHYPSPHPLRSFQTDVPDMLRMDNKSYEEASLIESFVHYYGVKPKLNGTIGSKGIIISEGYDIGIDKQTPVLNS